MRSEQPQRRANSAATLGAPRPGAGQQGELTDAAASEVGPRPPILCPLRWAGECPCRPGPGRISGACRSGVRSQPRQKAAAPAWAPPCPAPTLERPLGRPRDGEGCPDLSTGTGATSPPWPWGQPALLLACGLLLPQAELLARPRTEGHAQPRRPPGAPIPGPLSWSLDSAPGAARRCPAAARPPGGALCALKPKSPAPGAGGPAPGPGSPASGG